MKIENSENWLLVGASKGLGFEFYKQIQSFKNKPDLILASRKLDLIENTSERVKFVSVDLSKIQNTEQFIQNLKPISRLIYFAGGGPYGDFEKKSWRDHEWAWNVNFLSAARILHEFLPNPTFKQAILIGSQIAENAADPGASSYSSAKHALRGLVVNLQAEIQLKNITNKDIRLFSPGYMNTTMLPKSAWPRQQQGLVKEVSAIAQELIIWMQDSNFYGQNWSKPNL